MIPNVEILLSTYNGARYLCDFLQSLVTQNHEGWRLIARDDGSTDETRTILEEWRTKFPDRIVVIDSLCSTNLGAVASFSRLLAASQASHVMFADQDDVWLPFKIKKTVGMMVETERLWGIQCPILVHTDLTVVANDLAVRQRSLWRSQGVCPRGTTFARTLVENTAWGCTQMLNRALIERVGEIPRDAVYHDWWITLTATAFGRVAAVDQPTILYRRHDANESDITDLKHVLARAIGAPSKARRRLRELLGQSRPRACLFLERHRADLTITQISAIRSFTRLQKDGAFKRRLSMLTHGLLFTSAIRSVGMMALV